MRLLDLFCGAGGAAMGYHRAGFDVVGVDIKPQPNYPFEFWLGDALRPEWDMWEGAFDAIHASPPCQAYSLAQRIRSREHADLIGPTRDLLNTTGLPWVIENVAGAPLIEAVVLEGQMFGLGTHRPRYFEANWPLEVEFMRPPPGRKSKMGRPTRNGELIEPIGNFSNVTLAREALGTPWMTRDEMAEAIPPAYTELIGTQLLSYLKGSTHEQDPQVRHSP